VRAAAVSIALLSAGLLCVACDAEQTEFVIAAAPPDGDVVAPDRYNAFLRAEALAAGYAEDSREVDEASRTIEIVLSTPIVLSSLTEADIDVLDSTCGEPRPLAWYAEPGSLAFGRTFTRREFGEGDCEGDSDDRTCDTVRFRMRPNAVAPDTDLEIRVHGGGIRRYQAVGGTRQLGGIATTTLQVRREDASEAPVLIGYTLRVAGEGGVLPGLLERGAGGEYFFPPSGVIRGRFDRRPERLNAIFEDADGKLALRHDDIPIGGPNGPYRGDADFRVDRDFELGERVNRFELVNDDHFFEFGTPRRFELGAPAQGKTGDAYVQRVGLAAAKPTAQVTAFTVAHLRIETSSCPVIPTGGDYVLRATRLPDSVAQVEVLVGPADRSALPEPVAHAATMSGAGVTITIDPADLAGADRVILVRALDANGDSLGSDRITASSGADARIQTIEAAIRDIKTRGPHYYDLSSADRACFDALVTARQQRRGRSDNHSPTCAQRAPFPSVDLTQEPQDCQPSELKSRPSR